MLSPPTQQVRHLFDIVEMAALVLQNLESKLKQQY